MAFDHSLFFQSRFAMQLNNARTATTTRRTTATKTTIKKWKQCGIKVVSVVVMNDILVKCFGRSTNCKKIISTESETKKFI